MWHLSKGDKQELERIVMVSFTISVTVMEFYLRGRDITEILVSQVRFNGRWCRIVFVLHLPRTGPLYFNSSRISSQLIF